MEALNLLTIAQHSLEGYERGCAIGETTSEQTQGCLQIAESALTLALRRVRIELARHQGKPDQAAARPGRRE